MRRSCWPGLAAAVATSRGINRPSVSQCLFGLRIYSRRDTAFIHRSRSYVVGRRGLADGLTLKLCYQRLADISRGSIATFPRRPRVLNNDIDDPRGRNKALLVRPMARPYLASPTSRVGGGDTDTEATSIR